MTHRPPRRTRAHLDSLIAGRPTTSDPLVDLVAAVRAPAQPHELGGLDAAVAAFAAAPGVASPTEEKISMLKSVAGKLLALKILAVTAGAAAAGGVAYAAVNGDLPTPNSHSAAVAAATSGAPSSGEATEPSGTESDSSSAAASTSASESSSSAADSASPSPSLQGLCTAWLAHTRDIAKVSTNPAFSYLIKSAGGADAVNGYCTSLLATAHPSHPAHPTQAQDSSHSKPAQPTQAKKSSHPAPPSQARNTKSKPAPTEEPTSSSASS